MTAVESLIAMEEAYDAMTGEPGAGAKITATTSRLPDKFVRLSQAFAAKRGVGTDASLAGEKLRASARFSAKHGASSACAAAGTVSVEVSGSRPAANLRPLPHLAEYQRLLSQNPARAAKYYEEHADAILSENAAHVSAGRQEIANLYGDEE